MLTEAKRQERARERSRRWHHKMTAERRCHWCGKLSCLEYVNACKEHLELSRATTSYLKKQERERRKERSLCADCGKRPPRLGYENCHLCSAVRVAYKRRRRSSEKYDFAEHIKSLKLIDVDEAASILGRHRVRVHQLIDKGILQVRYEERRRFWLAHKDVQSYLRQQGKRLSLQCRRCRHQWYPIKADSKPRCPIKGCRGLIVDRIA